MDDDVVVNEKFDFLMLNIAKECGDINSLMNVFFSFLLRKTDFITNSKNVEQCEEIVLKTLRKHYKKKNEYVAKMRKEYEKMDQEKKRLLQRECTGVSGVSGGGSVSGGCTSEEAHVGKNASKSTNNGTISGEQVLDNHIVSGDNTTNKETKQQIASAKKSPGKGSRATDESDDSDEEPPKGNGGRTDKYTWTQTLNSVDMYIRLDDRVTTKDIKVDLTYKKLYVKVKNNILIDGEFHKHIKSEDSIWTLEDNRVIHLCIEKFNGMEWWSTVIKGDAEIDVKKIVPENSRMEDLDDETRSIVEKMMYDQKQKAMNLPTSDEQKKYEIFEKFKKMHPEMDFSKANINYGNSPGGTFFGR
ncbi:nuclear movement protein, putative [Plasmodium ovale]|uniref:Nuclear migration protein nudC n=2 Tax=Plasmodium ovale TaxID=36330 RepID=A0A1A8WV92_PLAOA|nr:nuclear movement protein, putative [Plasmodium ovale curtisi]SBS96260.1 nuclear movement protein, putative [Plasmodium ovale curtisi]SCP05398.1 nuclear movement protein, putative [Plasmodium ovale]